jgi:hypothetical protein
VDPILVPAPPRSAYNPDRRVSDLLYNQLKHFQHVEIKRGDLGIDPVTARNIHTEGGAAKYIAAVTAALRGKALATATPPANLAVVPASPPSQKATTSMPLSIAAAAAEVPAVAKNRVAKKTAVKQTPAKRAAARPKRKG